MVPLAVGVMLIDVGALARHGSTSALGLLSRVLVVAFYALIIICYLRRGRAVATSRSMTAHAAAVVATWLAFVFPLIGSGSPGAVRQAAGDLLIVTGMAWALWALYFLGRNVSVLAQARDVVDRGPYRWVRHPLYTGEIVSSLGIALAAGGLGPIGAWVLLCALQVYRAIREEQVLLLALPSYSSYRRRTAALLPGLF
jgi:protein-S-isoprenylcysteine O-methyltransferase Ste14